MPENRYPRGPVLLVDDEKAWLRSLSLALERLGGINNIIQCDDSRRVMDILKEQPISVVILDLTMPHLSGEKLLPQIVENYPELPVIILTGVNQIEISVRCIKAGAYDYIVKTAEEERLIGSVKRAVQILEIKAENQRLRESFLGDTLKQPEAFSEIVTQSPKMKAIFHYLEAVVGSRQPILITGESGVGKELVANAIHQLSPSDGPLVSVNVAGLDDNVFSDTLFGHIKGAFTGADQDRSGMVEQATRGTLFLDEIGDLSLTSQIKLLRLLQEGEYLPLGSDRPKKIQTRIVLATNQDLLALENAGKFRKDLYYRLHTHVVTIPPLRERKEDIPLLLNRFMEKAANSLEKKTPTAPPELATLLSTYHFPGNVRELEGMVYNAVSTHQAKKLSMESFRQALGKQEVLLPENGAETAVVFSDRLPTIEEAVGLLIDEAMQRAAGNQSIAANLLGISRPALNKRLNKNKD